MSADTLIFDSAKLGSEIVHTAATIINAVPDVNPAFTYVKLALLFAGGLITGHAIHFFKKRNENKLK